MVQAADFMPSWGLEEADYISNARIKTQGDGHLSANSQLCGISGFEKDAFGESSIILKGPYL